MKALWSLLMLSLVLCGCGYTPSALGPGIGVASLYIEPMVNHTPEPLLDSLVSNSLISRFSRDSRLTLVSGKKAATGILSGFVSSYSRTPVAYDRTDSIREYRSTMAVTASLQRVADGKILWKGTVSWSDTSLNNSDRSVQSDQENVAIQKISERLADQLYHRINENF